MANISKERIKEMFNILFENLYTAEGDGGFLLNARFGGFNEERFKAALQNIEEVKVELQKAEMSEMFYIIDCVSELRETLLNESVYFRKHGDAAAAKRFDNALEELTAVLETEPSE